MFDKYELPIGIIIIDFKSSYTHLIFVWHLGYVCTYFEKFQDYHSNFHCYLFHFSDIMSVLPVGQLDGNGFPRMFNAPSYYPETIFNGQ